MIDRFDLENELFDRPLFSMLSVYTQLNATTTLICNDEYFAKDFHKILENATRDNHLIICYNKYYGPWTDEKLYNLKALEDFYRYTATNSKFIFISSFDFPHLNDVKNIYYFYFPEYHAYYYSLYQNYNLTSADLHKKFLCLNKRGTHFRQVMYRAFYNYDLLESSYFSYLCESGHCGKLYDEQLYDQLDPWINSWVYQWPELKNWKTLPAKFLALSNEKTVLDQYQMWSNQQGWETQTTVDPTWVHEHNLYSTSFCSVVIESCVHRSAINISEKTIRAFCLGHPAIVLGVAGTVEYLRNMGFDMFDDIINHSYDLIEDEVLRTRSCIESIRQLNEKSLDELTELNKKIQDRRQRNIDVVKKMYQSISQAEYNIAVELKKILALQDSFFEQFYPTKY